MTEKKVDTSIRPGEMLAMSDFLGRVGLGRTAWQKVRETCDQDAIKIVSYVGKRGYVHTDGWLSYVEAHGASEHNATTSREES